MSLLAFLAGIALPTLSGWLLLRTVEGAHPVLQPIERWIAGFVLGITLAMFATFLCAALNLTTLNFWGFALPQLLLTALLASLWRWRRGPSDPLSPLPSGSFPRNAKIGFGIAGGWIALKLIAGSFVLLGTPTYFDDVYNNWNLRGKEFLVTGNLRVGFDTSGGGVHSYPPTIPMMKTWLALLRGGWSESLANSINLCWWVALVALFFFALRRFVSLPWALFGTYLFASIPLLASHLIAPYAEIFLAVHLFLAVSFLFAGAMAETDAVRSTFLRLAAVASALLVLTKNEAVMLYLPLLLLAFAATLFMHRRKELKSTILFCGLALSTIVLPWLFFKWRYGLVFGNAKAATGFAFGWQPNVLRTIWINLFLEGSWLLLFPLFFFLLALRFKRILHSPLVLLAGFIIAALALQSALYLFTSLSVEALMQTGFSRGILQLLPVIMLLTTMLIRDAFTTSTK